MHAGGPVVGSGAEFVLERINLPMLVLDLGVVGVASPIDERARRIEARVDLNATSRLRQIETIVGRLLDVELVASVCVTRADSWGGAVLPDDVRRRAPHRLLDTRALRPRPGRRKRTAHIALTLHDGFRPPPDSNRVPPSMGEIAHRVRREAT